MNESENLKNHFNKPISKTKIINEKNFFNTIALLADMLKQIEKEWHTKNVFNDRDKNKIRSLFSLLYYELTLLKKLSKIDINSFQNKNPNHINSIINSDKEIFSKKISQFLLFNNEINKNIELYKSYLQYDSIIQDTTKNRTLNIKDKDKNKIKNNSLIKNKIQLSSKIRDTKASNKTLCNDRLHRTINHSMINNNKKILRNNFINLQDSHDFKAYKTYKNNLEQIQKEENNKIFNSDEKRNKSINNYMIKELPKIDKEFVYHKKNNIKKNLLNHNISLPESKIAEQDPNPVRKVKNIIIKVRNKNNSIDSNNEKNSNNKYNYDSNDNNSNNIYEYNFYKNIENDKDNSKNNCTKNKKEREAKEILFDCMNQVHKKLNSFDKKIKPKNN